MSLDQETDSRLHSQLVRLGDMIGDGLHLEPDGKWISEEYSRICRALGYTKPKKRDSSRINEAMINRVSQVLCQQCQGKLKQTRSGSKRAICIVCKTKYQLLK